MMMENETMSVALHDNIVNELFYMRNLTLARLRELLEAGKIDEALTVISYYKIDG
jgi:hypothetical protein